MLAVIRETIKTYAGNPLRFVEVQFLKLRGIADPFEIPNNLNFFYGMEISPILRFMLGYGVIFPLAAIGFFVSLRNWRDHLLVWLFGLTAVGSLMSTIILGRYRLILVPVLIAYAAIVPVIFFTLVRHRELVRATGLLGVIIGVTLIQNWVVPIPILREIPTFTIHGPLYSLSARLYASEGKFDQALEEISRLRIRAQRYPDFPANFLKISLSEGDYRVAWAMHLLEAGRLQAAREQLALAEAAYAVHLHLSKPYYNLGLVYLKLSEATKARSLFERFLEIETEGIRAESVRQILSGLVPTHLSPSLH
jgi:hypothetical protein